MSGAAVCSYSMRFCPYGDNKAETIYCIIHIHTAHTEMFYAQSISLLHQFPAFYIYIFTLNEKNIDCC